MWLDRKLAVVLPPSIKKRLIGYYELIHRPSEDRPNRPLSKAELQRLNLLVWGLIGLSIIALIASFILL